MSQVQEMEVFGQRFGGDLYEAEVIYLMESEWALTAEDIMWPRNKPGPNFNVLEFANPKLWIINYRKSDSIRSKKSDLRGVG